MDFKNYLEIIQQEISLSEMEAYELMRDVTEGKFTEVQSTALIILLSTRNISLNELKGFRDSLLQLALKVNLNDFDCIDLCGTGGDGKNTFNISTLSSFIVAGAGYHVAKHGNYGVSSISGSSNVMEKLGYCIF